MYTRGQCELEFLDMSIEVDEAGQLQTDVHRKSTSLNLLLHASSAHIYATI